MIIRSLSQPIRRITRVYRLRSESWKPQAIRISFSVQMGHSQLAQPKLVSIKSLPHLKPLSDDVSLKNQLEFKQQELDAIKQKLKLQIEKNKEYERQIKDWEQRYQDQLKAHNQEIVQLKCNLDNSIFEDNQNEILQDNQVLQVIQEESEIIQPHKSLIQSQQLDDYHREIIQSLDKFDHDVPNNGNADEYILIKVKKLVETLQTLEMELDDWKRNYWSLEKRLNQYQQMMKEQLNTGQEIEIEFDFEKNQIVQTHKQDKKQLAQARVSNHSEIKKLKDEIDRLNQINSQLLEQQRTMSKQLLENLIVRQKKQEKQKKLTLVNEVANKSHSKISTHRKEVPKENNQQQMNHYFSNYFQNQQPAQQAHPQPISQYYTHRNSPMGGHSAQFGRINTTQQSKDQSVEKLYNFPSSVYSTPIVVKQSSLSPYQNKRYIQF